MMWATCACVLLPHAVQQLTVVLVLTEIAGVTFCSCAVIVIKR
jgi:hypothetical protein